MGDAGQQAAAGSSATKPTTPAPVKSPRQVLIGFRERPQHSGLVPAWLFTSDLGTLDLDSMVDGTTPNDQWRWSTDGDTAVYEERGFVGEFQDLFQLSAPAQNQPLEGAYQWVDDNSEAQPIRFDAAGNLMFCDLKRHVELHEHYEVNGFALVWTRESGAVERHSIFSDPSEPGRLWLGAHRLVQGEADGCNP